MNELEGKIKNCKNDSSIFNTKDYVLLEDVEELMSGWQKVCEEKDKIIRNYELQSETKNNAVIDFNSWLSDNHSSFEIPEQILNKYLFPNSRRSK